MKHCFRLTLAVLLCILLDSPTFAAKVKKKKGEVIEGKIIGGLVLKVKQFESTENSKRKFTTVYIWIDGGSIRIVDEKGIYVLKDGYMKLYVGSKENTPPDDVEVLETDILGTGSFGFSEKSTGAMVAAITSPFNEKYWSVPSEASISIAQSYGQKEGAIAKKVYEQQKLLSEEYKVALAQKSDSALLLSGKLLGRLKDGKIMTEIEIHSEKGVVRIPVGEIAGSD